MSSIKLLIHSRGTRKWRERLYREICSIISDRDFSSILFLVPEQYLVEHTREEFFSFFRRTSNSPACIPFHITTPRELAFSLYQRYGDRVVISERMRSVVMLSIVGSAGYAEILSELYKKFCHYLPEKDLDEIEDELKTMISEERVLERIQDAMKALRDYEGRLSSRGFIDPDRAMIACIDLLKELDYSLLVIEGFYDPTTLERMMISSMIEMSQKTIMSIEKESKFMDYVEHTISDADRVELRGSKRSTSLPYYAYPSMEYEVQGIAGYIKSLLIEGARPWEITVTFPELKKYLPMVRRIFRRFDIPINTGWIDLSSSPPLILLKEIITCIEEDFPRNSMLEVITSPCLTEIPEPVKRHIVSLSYRAGIIRGRDSWLSMRDTILKISHDENPPLREILDQCQRVIDNVIKKLSEIGDAGGISEKINKLEKFLNGYGYFKYLNQEDIPHGVDVSEYLETCFSEIRVLSSLIKGDKRKELEILKLLLEKCIFRDHDLNGVRILPVDTASVLDTEYMIIGGMIEGEYPSRPQIDPILPESIKEAMGLPFMEYYIKRQREYFERLINISSHDPFISYPSGDGDRLYLPSPLLDWEMVTRPPDTQVATEEDVLIYEGMAHRTPYRERIFLEDQPFQDPEAHQVLIERIRDSLHGVFNVTDIDSYRMCPYRFYIERILGLGAESPPKFQVEHRIWGSLAHRTMEIMLKTGDFTVDEIEERLFKALSQALGEYSLSTFWERVAVRIFRRLLPSLKIQEESLRKEGFIPYMFETRLSHSINGWLIRGKIDRIDVHRDSGGVCLMDYKTGEADKKGLQMPLYALLWQNNHSNREIKKAGFYSLKNGMVSWVFDHKDRDECINNALEEVKQYIDQIIKGEFLPAPKNDSACRRCDHKPVCEKGA